VVRDRLAKLPDCFTAGDVSGTVSYLTVYVDCFWSLFFLFFFLFLSLYLYFVYDCYNNNYVILYSLIGLIGH